MRAAARVAWLATTVGSLAFGDAGAQVTAVDSARPAAAVGKWREPSVARAEATEVVVTTPLSRDLRSATLLASDLAPDEGTGARPAVRWTPRGMRHTSALPPGIAAEIIGVSPWRPGSQGARERAPWWAPLASAAVPGGGQAVLGQDRAIAYLAVEAYGWLRFASDVREARSQRDGYRTLAAKVARSNLSETRPVGDFEYYERMEHYVESGVFDAGVEDGVQPETDPESYNGFIWLRARTTFWEDPATAPPVGSNAYDAALDYYNGRAIKPEFRWSWRNAQLEQDVFRRTISRSNEAFRRSIQDLGVIIANHALSTVDAFVSVRIRNVGSGADAVGIEASVPWSPRLRLRR